MKYLLDTNICINFLRGKFEVDKMLKLKGLGVLLYFRNNGSRIKIWRRK